MTTAIMPATKVNQSRLISCVCMTVGIGLRGAAPLVYLVWSYGSARPSSTMGTREFFVMYNDSNAMPYLMCMCNVITGAWVAVETAKVLSLASGKLLAPWAAKSRVKWFQCAVAVNLFVDLLLFLIAVLRDDLCSSMKNTRQESMDSICHASGSIGWTMSIIHYAGVAHLLLLATSLNWWVYTELLNKATDSVEKMKATKKNK